MKYWYSLFYVVVLFPFAALASALDAPTTKVENSDLYLNIFITIFFLILISFYIKKQRVNKQSMAAISLELIQNNKKFGALFNDISESIILLKDEKYLDVNHSAVELFGYPDKDTFLNTPIASVAPSYQPNGELSQNMVARYFNDCEKHGHVNFEWLSKSFNGTAFWIEVSITKIEFNSLNVLHLVCRNINEKKVLQLELEARSRQLQTLNQELIEQKMIYESLFFDSSDGVSLFSKGKFINCNNALLAMFNFTDKEQFLQLSAAQLFPLLQPSGETSSKAAFRHLKNCYRNGQERFEWVLTRSDSTPLWVELVLTNITYNKEKLIHIVWRDISSKALLEQQNALKNQELEFSNIELKSTINNLKEAQKQLVESEKMASLGALVAGVAHEINTPVGISLTGITHFQEVSEKINEQFINHKLSQKSLTKYLTNAQEISLLIHNNLKRASELVSSFKQIAVDQSSEESRTINLKLYMDEILASLAPITAKTGIKITVNCPQDININIAVGALSQIISNLVMNSLDHAYHGVPFGDISLSFSLKNRLLHIIYKDDGIGIDDHDLPKIFDPFFTTNRENGGSGLGLNIVFNIVTTTFHGAIYCKSKRNQGVQFDISLII
jgi:PAS domain S-box-containing protein